MRGSFVLRAARVGVALGATLMMLFRPGPRIMDAGCGPAPFPRGCRRRKWIDLTLLDDDPRLLAQRREIGRMRVPGTLEGLPPRNGSVDVAVASRSPETPADPSLGLHELFRGTRPGGWIAITR